MKTTNSFPTICILLVMLVFTVIGCDIIDSPAKTDSTGPSGTYVYTILGIEQTLTFRGDTLEVYDVLDGKRVFEYKISEDGKQLVATSVATGKTTTESFKYIKEHECVVMNGKEYYKK